MVALLLATVALQTIIQASSLAFAAQPVKPADCLTSSTTITELVTCLDVFTVRSAYYTPTAYNAAQPTDTERTAWSSLITSLLKTDGDCKSSTIPESLEKIYKIQQFKDNLCVLFEQSSINGTYEKGWGTMIVPRSQKDVSRDIHFSAPHPGWERNTIQQAAGLFNSTQSRSFLVPGRNHNASTELSTCIIGNGNFKTDVAINTAEPFFDAIVAIREWQKDNGGCPAASCAFIQFRGKATTSCPSDAIFLSAGISSTSWYTDPTPRPVKALQKSLQAVFPKFTTTLPSDSKCYLLGTENVVGRYLNGVKAKDVCTTPATAATATGEFVQAFESIQARDLAGFELWSKAVVAAFPSKY